MNNGKRLPKKAREQLGASKRHKRSLLSRLYDAEEGQSPPPVTLPKLKWLTRPEIPTTAREREGADMADEPHPSPATADDRTLVMECAEAIKATLMTNAVRAIIEAGEQLSALRDRLIKSNRYDTTRLGWQQAFAIRPNPFPFNRCTAERLIRIYKFFNEWDQPLETLPIAWSSLFILAERYKKPNLIIDLINEGKIRPLSQPTELLRLGRDVGVIKHVGAAYRNLHLSASKDLLAASKAERIRAVLEALTKLRLTADDLRSRAGCGGRKRAANGHAELRK